MLVHFLRNLRVVLRALTRPTVAAIDEETTLPLRVRLADLDYNWHMNNARHLDVLELGRVDALVRSGLVFLALRRGLMPIVGSLQIRYTAELKPRERFRVHTRVAGWDDRWMWVEQEIIRVRDDKVCTRALFRAQMRARNGAAPPAELFRDLGFANIPPHRMPPHLAAFAAAEANLYRSLAAASDVGAGHAHHLPHRARASPPTGSS